jgi:hypothetical protein
MDALLKPKGIMVHRVDYGPHDVWRSYPDSTFLRIPEALWQAMGSNRGYPNRVRHEAVRTTIHHLGFYCAERVTRYFVDGSPLVVEFAAARRPVDLGPMFPY